MFWYMRSYAKHIAEVCTLPGDKLTVITTLQVMPAIILLMHNLQKFKGDSFVLHFCL